MSNIDSFKVNIRLENDTDAFTSGETLALTCVAESSDGVELTWYKNGNMLWLTDDRMQTTSKRDRVKAVTTDQLIISDASTEDSGEYSCMVTRGRKSVTSSTVVVHVEGKSNAFGCLSSGKFHQRALMRCVRVYTSDTRLSQTWDDYYHAHTAQSNFSII